MRRKHHWSLVNMNILFALALLSPTLFTCSEAFLARLGATASRSLASTRMQATASGNALIFDCDGVILESEGLHRDAYNNAFEEFGIDYRWTPEYYDELQNKIGGGKPKMRYYFGEYGWPTSKMGPPPASDQSKDELIDALQDRKTDIYKELIASGTVPVRPGFVRVVKEAKAIAGTKLAICSASTKTSCMFVLENLLGELLEGFDLILAGDDVERRKPDPMIYDEAAKRLGISRDRCIVVEDSLIGLQAALGAGMKCIITHTPSTASQDFAGAVKIYPELGDNVSAKDLLNFLTES